MHEGHGSSAKNLRVFKKFYCFLSVVSIENGFGDPGGEKPGHKAKEGGKQKAVKHFDPFGSIDATQIAVERDCRAGKPRDKGMTFAGGNSKFPGHSRPGDNGNQGRAKCDACFMGIAAEIHHVIDGHGYL
ncbi:hypothetical protein SDC9_84505 [bioreactor metagenome]|uniref:Uncharacterized protein n=1 Tax=bioreactor metagenome TaxID=1076179 RepID=A0A644ZAF4_9ZZZZ